MDRVLALLPQPRRVRGGRVLLGTSCGAAIVALLVAPGTALALAGGGSGGFGGGGGGGGGGGFGGGGGGFGFGGGGGGGEGGGSLGGVLILAIFAVAFLVIGTGNHWRASRGAEERQRFSLGRFLRHVLLWPIDLAVEWRRLRGRRKQVRLAAAEAAQDDPRFAPDVVVPEAERLFRTIQQAWTNDDRDLLARLVSADLMVEWERRLKGFAVRGWSNRVAVVGPVHVDYVGLRNAADDRSKRAIVRITARVRDIVIDRSGVTIHRTDSVSDTHHICEYWTLGCSGEHWTLLSVEQHHEGMHQLTEPVLPSPWSDTKALQREATLEQAAEQRIETGRVGEIAPATISGEARAAALDISMVDDRFAPRVLETEVDHAVAVWAEAIDGDDAPMRAIASATAADELLYPGDATRSRRLVVRGPRIRSVQIVELAGRETPPSMTVELHVTGVRYVEDRTTTTVLDGDKSVASSFAMRWRMELTDDDAHPWQIAAIAPGAPGAPAGAPPGVGTAR